MCSSDLAATGGDREKLRILVQKSIPAGENPEGANARVQAIHSAARKLSRSGALDDAVESARDQKVENSLEKSPYFTVKNGRLVLNGAIFQKLEKGVDAQQVDKAYKSFKIELSDTQSRLANLKSLSQELQGSINDIEFLTKDLSSMGVHLENNSQDSYANEARDIGLQMDALTRESREAIKNLENLEEKFEHARDRLATVLQISSKELEGSAQDLTAKIVAHLGRSAFDDQKLAGDLDETLGLLSEINEAAIEVQKLSDTIATNRKGLSKLSKRLLDRIQLALKGKDFSAEHAANLKKMHADLYPRVHYLNESEREEVQALAPMAAHIDSAMANAFASKYLSGFIRKSNQSKNRVESVNFTHIDEEVLRVEVILAYVEMSPDFSETEVRKRISLDLVPKVVKTENDHFDFIIRSLSLARDGSEKVELKTEFGIILESTMSLLNQLVEQLNDTPYAQLRFDYYPHLSLLRVKNGIPIFSSFPNFKISDIELEEGKIHLFGGVPGEELGQFIGKSLGGGSSSKVNSIDDRSSEPTNPEDFEKTGEQEALPQGDVAVRISQKLINDFYGGFRSGFLSHHEQDVNNTSLEGRVVSLFRGLEEFNMDYLPEGEVNAYLRGDLKEISKETADFFQQAVTIIAPFQGFRKGLKQGASHVIRFITFGKVEIEVNPDDYKVPSGEFAITLEGNSRFVDPALEMNFANLSLYDPVHHGALQPYIKLVKVAASVARVTGKVRDGLKSVVNLLPGVEMEIKGDNLDEVIFSYIAKMLVSQTNQNISGVKITPTSYKNYSLQFQEYQLIDGVTADIVGVEIIDNNLLIESRIQ